MYMTVLIVILVLIVVALIIWAVVALVKRHRRRSPKWRLLRASQETASKLAQIRGTMNVEVNPAKDFTSIELLSEYGYIVRNIGFDDSFKKVFLYTSPGSMYQAALDQKPFTSYGGGRGQGPLVPGMPPYRAFSFYDFLDSKVSINGRVVESVAMAIANDRGRDAVRKILSSDKPITGMHMTMERRNSSEGDFFFPIVIGDVAPDSPEARKMASDLFAVIYDIVLQNIRSGTMPMPNRDGSINLNGNQFSGYQSPMGGDPFSDF